VGVQLAQRGFHLGNYEDQNPKKISWKGGRVNIKSIYITEMLLERPLEDARKEKNSDPQWPILKEEKWRKKGKY